MYRGCSPSWMKKRLTNMVSYGSHFDGWNNGVDVFFPIVALCFVCFDFCCQWTDGWMKKELIFRMDDLTCRWDYGLWLSPSWMKKELMFLPICAFCFICSDFVASGWIEGWKKSWFLWRIDLVWRWDYGLWLSPSWMFLLCGPRDGWMDGCMDGWIKKELVFLGLVWFVWLC